MIYVIFGLGVLFILLGFVDVFPKIKENYMNLEDMQKWQLQKKEVLQAKEDLIFLLEELKNVSDQAVNSIESKIKEANSIDLPNKSIVQNSTKEELYSILKKEDNIVPQNEKNIKKKEKMISDLKEKKLKEDKNSKLEINKDNKETGILTKNLNDKNTMDKHTYIYQLSKQGVSVDEIAQKVQMGKGEIELIIGIKRRGEQA